MWKNSRILVLLKFGGRHFPRALLFSNGNRVKQQTTQTRGIVPWYGSMVWYNYPSLRESTIATVYDRDIHNTSITTTPRHAFISHFYLFRSVVHVESPVFVGPWLLGFLQSVCHLSCDYYLKKKQFLCLHRNSKRSSQRRYHKSNFSHHYYGGYQNTSSMATSFFRIRSVFGQKLVRSYPLANWLF
jgi:hypothetical protein